MDGRLTGRAGTMLAETPEFDPSMTAIRPPYTSLMEQYARGRGQGFADTSVDLSQALDRNRYMRVMIASGYYDLATPFHAVEYNVAHMGLTPELRKNFVWHEYESGHMMYIHLPSLKKLKADVHEFYGQ